MTVKTYRYVGPEHIRERSKDLPPGFVISAPEDVVRWVEESGQFRGSDDVTATFVIDLEGRLRIADRRSEHVACSGGTEVRSAGEITFALQNDVAVVEISNQSTGYCPEPQSWEAVLTALEAAGLDHPGCFTAVFEFRKCPDCRERNLVKDDWFECAVCGCDLPRTWNF